MANTEEKPLCYQLGVDEAGRGPVLGPMVYGVAWCRVDHQDILEKMGFADSKVLTAEQREKLFDDLKKSEHIDFKVDSLSPEGMSANMLAHIPFNLNAIAHKSTIDLIQAVYDQGINITNIYVDTVGPPESYQEKLSEIFPNATIIVAKKADSLYPIVSAASICAKVTRDLELKGYEAPYKEGGKRLRIAKEFGSGYPGDPATKDWLTNHFDPIFGWPGLVRFSWSTSKKILQEQGVGVEWGDEDDDQKPTRSLAQMWGSTQVETSLPLRKRHKYFRQRHMNIVCSFDVVD